MLTNASLTPRAAVAAVALSVAALATACTHGSGRSASTSVNELSEQEARSATAPAGTTFHATLDAPLSSQLANLGDRVSATLDQPLLALDGAVVAPKGAKLRGRVLDLGREGLHRFVIQFDTLEVSGQGTRVFARVTKVDGARVVSADPDDATEVAFEIYPMVPRTLEGREMGGGPPPEGLPVELPGGTGIDLYLIRPFTPDFGGSSM